MRPLVQEPMNATSIFRPLIGWLSFEVHELERFANALLLVGRERRRRRECVSLTPTDWPGLMPQVTVGSMSAASNVDDVVELGVRPGGEAQPPFGGLARTRLPCGANGRPRR